MFLIEWMSSPEAWIAFATLGALEIVLGIDNIVFISILVGRLPEHQRARTRTIGLGLAMLMRIVLLFLISWVMALEKTVLFEWLDREATVKDLVVLVGGLFLLGKSTLEIHHALEGGHERSADSATTTVAKVLVQVAILDLVFSLDSVITAVGLADELGVMVWAIVISVLVMMFAAGSINRFVDRHPTVKMLALSFLVLVGFTLVAEALHVKIPKGYVYFAMGFSIGVEMLNLKVRGRRKKARKVKLHRSLGEELVGGSGATTPDGGA